MISKGIKQILKFLVGGGSAVIIDFMVYSILKQTMGIIYAKTVSYISGAIVGFVINKFWTFESKKVNMIEIGRYICLYIASAGINTVVNKGMIILGKSTLLSFLCATGVSTIINFGGQKFFVFVKEG